MGDEIKLRRRAVIRPLCPIHLKAMSGLIDGADYYSCPQHGCGLHWRASSDYFRIFHGKPFRTIQQLQEELICSLPGHGHKFIAERRGTKAVWECSAEGCLETEVRLLPPKGVWEIPKEDIRSAANEVPSRRPRSTQDRAALNNVPSAGERPGWVWAICIFYAASFAVLVLIMYLFFSGAIPMTPQLKAVLGKMTAVNYIVIIGEPLLSVSAAVALFLLRREATYLFWSSFALAAASAMWQFAAGSGATAFNSKPGVGAGGLIGFGIQLAVCFYVENLRVQGTLR